MFFLSPFRARGVTHLGPWNIPKCLNLGCSGDQKWVKNAFFQSHPELCGMLKQVSIAHIEPMVTPFWAWKIPKCLNMGSFGYQKWVKNRSKMCVSNVIWNHSGCSNKYFEHVVMRFAPWKI